MALSDTHSLHRQVDVPPGDLLIFAGDYAGRDSWMELADFDDWLGGLPFRWKVVVAGNHDWCFERQADAARARLSHATYLQDEAVVLGGLKIYGSPWQPRFFDWAFNLDRGAPIRRQWDRIPDDTDILVTHGPPAHHGGMTRRGVDAGCVDLLDAVRRVRPRLHLFGHIHEGYGVTQAEHTTFANVSTCDVRYRAVNPAFTADVRVPDAP